MKGKQIIYRNGVAIGKFKGARDIHYVHRREQKKVKPHSLIQYDTYVLIVTMKEINYIVLFV